METTEINGFAIDKFNQYDLKVGAKESACPLCSHDRSKKNEKSKCSSLDWDRGIGTCHHCGEKFQLHTFKRKADKVYIKPKQKGTNVNDKVISYFGTRGISADVLQKAKVTTSPGWIHFNYYVNKELVNIKSRNGKKEYLLQKGAERTLYNLDNTVGYDYVIIVEGEIDALTCMECGFNSVVSVPNGAVIGNNNLDYLDNCIDYFSDKTKIIIATDEDEAGFALRSELIRRLGSEICHICEFGGYKDLNEALVGDGIDHVKRIIDTSTPLPLEDVNTIKDLSNEIDEFFKTGGPAGFKAGMENLDDIFSVLPGQYCVVTAVPTAGKTYFVDQYVLGLNKLHGWRVGMASVESKPDWIGASQLVRKMYGDYPQNIDTRSDRYHDIKDHLNDNFFFIDMERFTLDSVLKKASELVKRKGIKVLVLDPINRIRGKEKASIGEYTIEYFTKIDEWAKKHDCFVMVVAHPHKIYKLENGEWPEMTYYNIAGGADIANMAYHILSIHRGMNDNLTSVKVLKCKYNFLGKNGESAKFNYNMKTTNFDPVAHTEISEVPWEN